MGGDWAWLAACDANVSRVRCDASDDGSVCSALRALYADGMRLARVFHAAHQLADALLVNQHALNLRATYAPKAHGACALHAASWHAALRGFHVYSSAAGLMGSAGQGPHSAANAWLHAMALGRLRRGVCGQSVSWGAVAEIGYAARHGADRRAEASGSGAISRAMAIDALRSTLLPACRSFAVLPVDWARMLSGSSEVRGLLVPYAHLRGAAVASRAPKVAVAAAHALGLEAVL